MPQQLSKAQQRHQQLQQPHQFREQSIMKQNEAQKEKLREREDKQLLEIETVVKLAIEQGV